MRPFGLKVLGAVAPFLFIIGSTTTYYQISPVRGVGNTDPLTFYIKKGITFYTKKGTTYYTKIVTTTMKKRLIHWLGGVTRREADKAYIDGSYDMVNHLREKAKELHHGKSAEEWNAAMWYEIDRAMIDAKEHKDAYADD